MSSPIFDSTFGTGRFKHEEPMTTSGKPSPEPQNVRETPGEIARKLAVIELGVSDETFIGKIAAAIRAALAQPNAEQHDVWKALYYIKNTLAPYMEDKLGAAIKTVEAALAQSDAEQKLNEIADRYCAADRGVHGELIPDCPTEGVAARQGNGG